MSLAAYLLHSPEILCRQTWYASALVCPASAQVQVGLSWGKADGLRVILDGLLPFAMGTQGIRTPVIRKR